ncbi:peptide deformylase [Niameybacter massiliensis]|uniref:Peptide deformylase n=1 Tax=Holtiella tumoricola TaxID=3018743 RepID=A0AA42DQK7_9FIRM|nr:peptide deformylase [Holtiella tumoricola]MDA3733529.1 peptide deformylase [Holtiella tumoricola]
MIREIVKDHKRLVQKAVEATKEDLYIIDDMVDTAKANDDICVGLAANQIGEKVRIIVVKMGEFFIPLVNPKIVKHSQSTYEAEEACLSHEGTKKTTRYSSIEVEYRDKNFRKKKQHFNGFVAQVIQHEMDHCEGILI